MIDTVRLLLPPQHFKILNPNCFVPSPHLVYNKQVLKTVIHPKNNTYHPKIMLSHRMNLQGTTEIMLTIELSLPKLLFGNNLQELQTKDFDKIILTLHEQLQNFGIVVDLQNLKNAEILNVHFSKNIVLQNGSTPFHYIQKIKQSFVPARLDTNQTDYRNSGHCFKWHCNSYEIVFYDKLFDLHTITTSKKRAVDSQNHLNLQQLSTLRSKKKKFEVLRFEVRLNTRAKIKTLFKKLNIKNKLTLQSIFKICISKKILLYYLKIIEQKQTAISNFKTNSDQDLLSLLVFHNPHIKPKEIFSYIGYKKILENMTSDEIKKLISNNHISSFNRMIAIFYNVNLPKITNSSFDSIKQQISKYKPLKIKNKNI